MTEVQTANEGLEVGEPNNKQPAPVSASKKPKSKDSSQEEGAKVESDSLHYAIVEAYGHQYRVKVGDTVQLNRVSEEVGSVMNLDKVILVRSPNKVSDTKIGAPYLEGLSVTAKVVRHLRGPKIRVFKKRRRQNYRKTIGHRQDLTEIRILTIP